MAHDHPSLDWIDAQQPAMVERVIEWASINTGSFNVAGINRLRQRVAEVLTPISDTVRSESVDDYQLVDDAGQAQRHELAPALVAERRFESAPRRVLLCIHLDTVYGETHPFQQVEWRDEHTLVGPGVTDAKGGLCVMLTALEALERSDLAGRVGWRVVLNSDEELGSPGSASLLHRSAAGCDVGLLFEPSLPDGTLVSQRKGSGNFHFVVSGRSAHAGREPERGRSAILAGAQLVEALHALPERIEGVTVNVGRIAGGSALNVVPELCVVRANFRVDDLAAQAQTEAAVAALLEDFKQKDGIAVEMTGSFYSPPKPMDAAHRALMRQVEACGAQLNIPIAWRTTGGVCDGNKLAAAGLANIDTLGPRGGQIHSPGEYLLVDSLTERAKLTTLLLHQIARG